MYAQQRQSFLNNVDNDAGKHRFLQKPPHIKYRLWNEVDIQLRIYAPRAFGIISP